jgi:UDP-N-acetylglucosamine:LPS N-acetylglucosamine transferase
LPTSPKILVAPLDWGLGHATRCIPIIRELIRQGSTPLIASSGRALELLRAEFPKTPCLKFPAYSVQYPTNNMVFNMAVRLPAIGRVIWREYRQVRRLIRDHQIRGIISDQRYGCFSRKVPAVFLTHQLHLKIPVPFLSGITNSIHQRLIRQFDACWVPDEERPPGLAGALSHPPLQMPTRYVGILSRLSTPVSVPSKYDLLFLLSGPEPQRSRLEQRLLAQVRRLKKRILLVQGKTEKREAWKNEDGVQVVSFLTSGQLNRAIAESHLIVCRPGYSSLMDLARLGKPAVLIPTPGQTEQEYLAEQLFQQEKCFYQTQARIDLEEALSRAAEFRGFSGEPAEEVLLEKAVHGFLEGLED